MNGWLETNEASAKQQQQQLVGAKIVD